MFNSSAAPGRHKIISKLSIMFNTTLNNDSITFRFLEYVLWCFFFWYKNQNFPPIKRAEKSCFPFGISGVDLLKAENGIRIEWSIWIWSSDFLPASQLWIQTLRVTNSTSYSKSHSPESGFSKRKIASATKRNAETKFRRKSKVRQPKISFRKSFPKYRNGYLISELEIWMQRK